LAKGGFDAGHSH